MFSSFFRILFPYTGPYKKIKEENIFPKNKSHLELILDKYFSIERHLAGLNAAEALFGPPIEMSNNRWLGDVGSFVGDRLPGYHPSWEAVVAEAWSVEPDERFTPTRSTGRMRLRFRPGESATERASRLQKQIVRRLERHSGLREFPITWEIFGRIRGKVHCRLRGS